MVNRKDDASSALNPQLNLQPAANSQGVTGFKGVKSYDHWPTLSQTSHLVQFYEDERHLIHSIKTYIETGDVAIIIATAAHRRALKKQLPDDDRYLFFDAKKTLQTLMVDGTPHPDRFEQVIGNLVTKLSKKYKDIRAYGEMVALLWSSGNRSGAIRLEELWNNLQKNENFSLFCAYPLNRFEANTSITALAHICDVHTGTIANESFSQLNSTESQLREIAILQQKAKALEEEIVRHKVTEKKLFETMRALKASERFNRGIIENSADCIKILDMKGRLLSMNMPGCKVFEIDDLTQYIGRDYRDLWENGYYEASHQAIEQAKQGKVGRFQGFCPTAKGTPKWWDVVITPITDDAGNIDQLLAITRDITTIKVMEQYKEDFLNMTSHELKTPLTSQKVYIQLLNREVIKNNDEKYFRYLEKIDEQTSKLEKLVSGLFEVSNIQNGKFILRKAAFDLNACVKDVIDEVAPTTDSHVISLTGVARKKVYGDQDKICHVLLNLLTNAIKYSPHSNKVKVMIENNVDHCVVSVKDFGIGIEKKNQSKVFDRFFRANNTDVQTYPGLGMGLYLTSQIIEQHHEKIWLSSEKGKGSTFSFTLRFHKGSNNEKNTHH